VMVAREKKMLKVHGTVVGKVILPIMKQKG
jgi:hypothetical protein